MIQLQYNLTKEDYLNFQLYVASHNPITKRQLFNGRIITFLIFLILGIGTLENDGLFKYIFFILALLSFFLYPIYFKWFYKRHFKKHIEQSFDPNNSLMTIQLNDWTIEAQDKKSTSSTKLEELLSFVETRDHFYLQLDKIKHFILPKDRIPADEVKHFLLNRSKRLNIPYKEELNWK